MRIEIKPGDLCHFLDGEIDACTLIKGGDHQCRVEDITPCPEDDDEFEAWGQSIAETAHLNPRCPLLVGPVEVEMVGVPGPREGKLYIDGSKKGEWG